MRHFTVTSAFVESPWNWKRTGTPGADHTPKPDLIASINAGLKLAACVGANHTRIGSVIRFSQRRSIESPLASIISPRYVVEPLDRIWRRVAERARSSMYDGSRPSGPAGMAVPWDVVEGAWGGAGGGGCGSAMRSGPSVPGSGARWGAGRNMSQKMNRTMSTAAAEIIAVSRRSM